MAKLQATKDFGAEELRGRDSNVPWSRIAALCNVLAHQYLGVQLHGYLAEQSTRLERFSDRLERVERRLEIVET